MEEANELLQYLNGNIDKVIMSNPMIVTAKYRKIEIIPSYVKGKACYQMSRYTKTQVFQDSIKEEALVNTIQTLFPKEFSQIHILVEDKDISLKMTKKGKLLKNINKRLIVKKDKQPLEHNRRKRYLLEEGHIISPLVDMGIFTKDGRIVKSMYDKYRQINRFIELVDDILKDETKQMLHIIDFGCGKSYLTFILYYYLVEIKKKQVEILGLDLKEEVIAKCNTAAQKYGYTGISFELGDINGYKTDKPIDMVVSLHACDMATDYALYNAVTWNAKYIMSVPCCQHEVNGQIESELLAPVMHHGILKERMSAIITDAIRGNMLSYCGYKTQVMEFVDMAHSPKNLLIRAVKTNVSKEKRMRALQETDALCRNLHIEPSIYKLLKSHDCSLASSAQKTS